jgi:hypothetical protein
LGSQRTTEGALALHSAVVLQLEPTKYVLFGPTTAQQT